MNATQLFNSLIGELIAEKGLPISDAEIARMLEISPSTLSRYKSGEISLDQIDTLLKLIQEIPHRRWSKLLNKFLGIMGAGKVALPDRLYKNNIIKLGPMEFEEAELILNTVVIGDTGSGKTTGIVKPFISQVCNIYKHERGPQQKWGGLIVDSDRDKSFTDHLITELKNSGRDPIEDIVIMPSKSTYDIIKLQDPSTNKYWHISGEGQEVNILLAGSGYCKADLFQSDIKNVVFSSGPFLQFLEDDVTELPNTLKFIEVINIAHGISYNPLDLKILPGELADRLIAATPLTQAEPYWLDTTKELIANLIQLWKVTRINTPITAVTIARMVTQKGVDDNIRTLEYEINEKTSYVASSTEKDPKIEEEIVRLTDLFKYFTEMWGKLSPNTKEAIKALIYNVFGQAIKEIEVQKLFCDPTSFSVTDIFQKGKIVVIDGECKGFANVALKMLKLEFQELAKQKAHNGQTRLTCFITEQIDSLAIYTSELKDSTYLEASRKNKIINVITAQSLFEVNKVATDQHFGNKVWLHSSDQATLDQVTEIARKTHGNGGSSRFSPFNLFNLDLFDVILFSKSKRGANKCVTGSCEIESHELKTNCTQLTNRWFWREKLRRLISAKNITL